jgi:hypothetical protein
MQHTYPEALIVAALAAAFVAWMYFRHKERRHRLEIAHAERLAAMDKGIPLPELPLDPQLTKKPGDPREMLLHGIVWTALGFGGVVAMFLVPNGFLPWPLAMPLVFLGIGLILFYALGSKRSR